MHYYYRGCQMFNVLIFAAYQEFVVNRFWIPNDHHIIKMCVFYCKLCDEANVFHCVHSICDSTLSRSRSRSLSVNWCNNKMQMASWKSERREKRTFTNVMVINIYCYYNFNAIPTTSWPGFDRLFFCLCFGHNALLINACTKRAERKQHQIEME